MANLISSSNVDAKVRVHSGFTTTITTSFAATAVLGVGWDGTNIIYSNNTAGKFYKGTGTAATPIISSFANPGGQTYGYGWDGTDTFSNNGASKAYQLSGFSATIVSSFTSGTYTAMRGCANDGTNYLLSAAGTVTCVKFTGFSSTVTTSFTTNAQNRGCAWDGTNVITGDSGSGKIRKMTGFSSTIADSITTGSDNGGLFWDGFPAPDSGPANMKTWDGLAKASVKTMDGLALASVKTWNGLT